LCIWIESSRRSIRFLHCFSMADCTNLRTDWVLFVSPSCIMLIYLVAFLMVSSLVPRCESHPMNLYLAFVCICKSVLIKVCSFVEPHYPRNGLGRNWKKLEARMSLKRCWIWDTRSVSKIIENVLILNLLKTFQFHFSEA
jgi:hypothetical protein